MDILLGLQWGDEGKGKIIDYLAGRYELIARFQGGPNAGHTLYFQNQKYVLHQLPSGIFYERVANLMGNGMVIDPITLQKEVDYLKAAGHWKPERVYLAHKASLILPSHRLLDHYYENQKGLQKIGSTLRGIGPAYTDKVSRNTLKVGDLIYSDFDSKYSQIVQSHLAIIGEDLRKSDRAAFKQAEARFFKALEFIKTFQLVKGEYFMDTYIRERKAILAEGAQGSLLDLDFGTYPYVTSSNTLSAAAALGLGIAPQQIKQVYGIFKSYTTRVGSGPFPTELTDEVGQKLRALGQEYGATTGRPRRCGWLDLILLKYTVMLNGVTALVMTKADVLNRFETVSVCTGYELDDGTITEEVPFKLESIRRPLYKTFKGWNSPLDNSKTLPVAFRTYLDYIQNYVGVPIAIVSLGPRREETRLLDVF